jgi:hypothetical protein
LIGPPWKTLQRSQQKWQSIPMPVAFWIVSTYKISGREVPELTQITITVLGDRKSVKEMAHLYQKVYGVEPQIQRMGSLEDLREKMTSIFKENPRNIYAWMGMYYQYYMANGSTSLGKLDNERYPGVVPKGLETFLKGYTKETVANSARF